MWVLEFHKIKTDEWFVWCRGSLEDCLEDALELKAGLHGWGNSYDAARLGYAREDFPVAGTVYEGNIAAEPEAVMLAAGMEGEQITDLNVAAARAKLAEPKPAGTFSMSCPRCGGTHEVEFVVTGEQDFGDHKLQEWTGRMPMCAGAEAEVTFVPPPRHVGCGLHEDCVAAGEEARQRFHDTKGAHLWKRNDAQQVWRCELCPALVTEEELHRVRLAAVRGPDGEPNSTEDLVTMAWAFKAATGQT